MLFYIFNNVNIVCLMTENYFLSLFDYFFQSIFIIIYYFLFKSLEFHLRNSQYDTMNRIQKYEDEELHWSHMIGNIIELLLLLKCNLI